MPFLIVPADITVETSEAAARSIHDPWNWLALQKEIATLSPGDELEVTAAVSVIALSGTTKEFKA